MYIFWMVAVGLVIGAGARLVMDTRGYATPMTVGVVGSCLVGFLGRQVGWFQGPVNAAGITTSVVGAVLALLVYRGLSRRRARGAR